MSHEEVANLSFHGCVYGGEKLYGDSCQGYVYTHESEGVSITMLGLYVSRLGLHMSKLRVHTSSRRSVHNKVTEYVAV